jgi:uncharacterized protein YndB with AHSA1/START domain
MSINNKTTITAEVEINAPIETVWARWTEPEHIMQWNTPSDDWKTSKVENDLQAGGRFLFVMELKDGSSRFNFKGVYDEIKTYKLISYTLDDGRQSTITFTKDHGVRITETFEPEASHPFDMQKDFCQAVLDGFKRYAEAEI